MKKLFALPLILIFMLTLAACGETTSEEKEVESVNADSKTSEPATTEEEPAEDESEKQEFNEEVANSDNVLAKLISVEKIVDTTFDEEKYEVKFEVENKRDDTIAIQAREVSADGKMIDEGMLTMSTDIAGGKKADAVLTIQNFEGDLPELNNDLEMLLHVISWDDMEFEEQHEVNIQF